MKLANKIVGIVQKAIAKIKKEIGKLMYKLVKIAKFAYNETKNSGLLKKVLGVMLVGVGVGGVFSGCELYEAGSYQVEKERSIDNEAVKQHC